MVISIEINIRDMIVNKIIITANTSWNIFNFRLDLIQLLKKNKYNIFVISNKDKTTNKFTNAVEFINVDLKKRNLNL